MHNAQDNGGVPEPVHVPAPPGAATARPVYMPQTFNGADREWSDWVGQFEMAADVNGWDDALKLKFMALLLSGRARDIYTGLSTESRTDYIQLKEAMGKCLEPCDSADWHRANFLGRRRLHNETIREFGTALRRLISKAYPSADNSTRELFARDHFIEHVGKGDLRVNLRSAKPATLEEAINLASELELIRSLEHTHLTTDTQVRGVVEKSSSEKQMELLLGVVEGLRQEVKVLQQTVQSSQAATNTGRSQGPRGWDSGRAYQGRGEVCWECGCDRHIKKNCPYLPGN